MPEVLTPFGAGVGSAIGLLQAAPKIEVSITSILDLETSIAEEVCRSIYEGLESRVSEDLKRLGATGTPKFNRYGYFRYKGQGYEIRTDLPEGPINSDFPARVAEAFHATYEKTYGYADREAAIEAVDWHLVATLPLHSDKLDLGWHVPKSSITPRQRKTWQPEANGFVETKIYDRRGIFVGTEIVGPAIIEDPEATIVIPSGDTAIVTENGHIRINIGSRI